MLTSPCLKAGVSRTDFDDLEIDDTMGMDKFVMVGFSVICQQ